MKTWFFNADFEKSLFQRNFQTFQSNPLNQEFEYLINYLHPQDQIYTLKGYTKDFRERFEKITAHSFKVTNDKSGVEAWGQSYQVDDKVKELQAKTILLGFKKLGLIQHDIKLIEESSQLEEGFIYKIPYSFSGLGHFLFPQDKLKIEKALKESPLIKEEKLNRISDFSTLIENNQILCCYENLVDGRFQYKGTRITPISPVHSEDEIYKNMLKEVFQLIDFYPGVCSIDSFYYEKSGHLKLQPISEINMRKSMGYFAYKFKEKYFSNSDYVQFMISTKKLNKRDDPNIITLAPQENKLQAYFLIGSELAHLEDLALFLTK